jgi:hypothetical protein
VNRMRRLGHWLWPLLATAGTVLGVWALWFQRRHVTPQGDPWIAVAIGAAYVVAILFILGTTDRWSLRGLGQVAAYVGDACLYLGAGAASEGWRHPLAARDLNLIRAELLVGGAALVGGLLWWTVASRGEPPVDERDGRLAVLEAELAWSRKEIVRLKLKSGEVEGLGIELGGVV